MEAKTPKGTRDFDPFLESQRQRIITTIKDVASLFGAQPIQTPIFEVKHLLMDKYGGGGNGGVAGNDSDKQVYQLNEADTIVSKIKDLKTSCDGSPTEEKLYKCVDDFEKAEQYILRYDLTVPFSRYMKTRDCTKLTR